MAVVEVWGRIEGYDVTPVSQSGDSWLFPAPMIGGTYVAEFWARDEAGNTAYRGAILTVENGSIKCIRWLTDMGEVSMRLDRPCVGMVGDRAVATMGPRPTVGMLDDRPLCTMVSHVCPMMEA